MRIIVYGLNYAPELTGVGKYSGEMGGWLSEHGHSLRAISAPPYYPEWKVKNGYSTWRYQKSIINGVDVFRVPIVVPKRPTIIKRAIHLISYSIASLPVAISQTFWKPDVVVFVQPTLFASIGALFLAKMTGARSLLHIQDYEIDAMFGLGMMNQGLLASTVKKCESWIMRRFDIVSTISYSMMEAAKRKGVPDSRLLYFPNWSDTEFVTPEADGSALKAEWGFNKTDKIVLYAGNIGKKQGLELVLDAAECLLDNQSLHFVIVGAGAHVDVIKDMATDKALNNIHFKPLLPWDQVPQMLALADIHLVVQKRGAADVVLPSKLTNILSAGGHAIVTAEKNTELGMLAKNYPEIYECIEPENLELFIDALQSLLEKDLRKPNQIARDYAVEYLSKEKVLSRFENDLKSLVGGNQL